MITLQDAMELGQGIERPFSCPSPDHEDKNASASVNVLKGVWVCYACHAKGAVDKKKAPSLDALAQMLEPEKSCRIYPETYLELFDLAGDEGYWHQRFPDWLVWRAGLGEDPVTGHATFPVYTPQLRLAGVGRRIPDADVEAAKEAGTNPSRYRYPPRWSASHSLPALVRGAVLFLVEGYADACSLWEIGVPAAPVFGSALHYPQVEHLLRMKPRMVVLAMDDDDAGHRGKTVSMSALSRTGLDLSYLSWNYASDPAACTPEQRMKRVCTVAGLEYRSAWDEAVAQMRAAHEAHLKEST